MTTTIETPESIAEMCVIESHVIEKIRRRGAVGLRKYGVTLDRHDLSMQQWFTHRQEEAMDMLQYDEVLIGKIDVMEKAIRIGLEAVADGNLEVVRSSLELLNEVINGAKE